MYSLDQLTNACQPVTLAGAEYQVRQLRLSEWGELQAWLKSVCPPPLAVAAQAVEHLRSQGIALNPEIQNQLYEQAQAESRRWPPRVGSGAWLMALEDVEGGTIQFIRVAIRAGGTELSEDEAANLVERITVVELANLMRICLHGDYSVPKSTTPQSMTSPTTGENGSSASPVSSQAGLTETSAT